VFPQTYEDLLQLPGVGPYSAAAIASFAYGLPYPVVDGNVKRVIARYCGITTPLSDTSLHEQIRSVASSWMKGISPGDFNQAIMNFGALICKPKSALCHSCPLSKNCYAYTHHAVDDLPVRSKKKTSTLRYFHFIVIHYRGKILLHRRDAKDIWHGLYVPPLVERNSSRSPSMVQIHAFVEKITGQDHQQFMESSSSVRQLLSHQTIHGRFHHIKLLSPPKKLDSPYTWVTHKTMHEYGKPKMIVEMFERLYS
jgi:A/G-specific adenine glycosylase